MLIGEAVNCIEVALYSRWWVVAAASKAFEPLVVRGFAWTRAAKTSGSRSTSKTGSCSGNSTFLNTWGIRRETLQRTVRRHWNLMLKDYWRLGVHHVSVRIMRATHFGLKVIREALNWQLHVELKGCHGAMHGQ